MTSQTQSWGAPSAMDHTEAVGWGWTMSESPEVSARRSWTRRVLGLGFWAVTIAAIVGFLGFLGFVYSLDRFEQPPETRADGIVAMTGPAPGRGGLRTALSRLRRGRHPRPAWVRPSQLARSPTAGRRVAAGPTSEVTVR